MKILFLANISGKLDEGMKNSTFYLVKNLSKNNIVLIKSLKEIIKIHNLFSLISFRPDIIHYTMGPTIKGLFVLKILKSFTSKSSIIISTPRPQITSFQSRFLFGFKPDLTLVHSNQQKKYFDSFNWKTEKFPLGVDINKFNSGDTNEKDFLKRKLKLDKYRKILLHVGQITKVRQVEKLIDIQNKSNYQVIIIAASSIEPDKLVMNKLVKAGIVVINHFVEHLEEYYKIADVFVFPGAISASSGAASAIEIPLSVLEAMASGLPVITAKFGGLPDIFLEDECFAFAQTTSEILSLLSKINMNCKKNRQKVLKFSWDRLSEDLLRIYEKVLNEKK